MAFYHKSGKIPPKKHTTFYKEDKKSLYWEELVSSKGFSGIYSIKYHIHEPTKTTKIEEISLDNGVAWDKSPLMYYYFDTDKKKSDGDFLSARNVFLRNNHCSISTAHPNKNPDYFYRNAFAHEYIFVHRGKGIFTSDYGSIPFGPGDQLIVPLGTTFQILFDTMDNNKLFIVESDTPFEIPKHYRNDDGQLLENAPLCERDIVLPEYCDPVDKKGDFRLFLKANGRAFDYTLEHHPYDVVGWDGHLYPFIFNIKDYAPKVGKLHLPPPTHLLFDTQHFVLCNFCPRPFDFHPDAIPAPYFHSNVDSDEVIYYVEGEFLSRKGVKEGSVTLHPMGIPHGPQPGKIEESIGKKGTNEYAIMVDTFEPLQATLNVRDTMDPKYFKSWLTE